ncbi:MAG TPA: response regulator transcription factor [Sphingobium sp.]
MPNPVRVALLARNAIVREGLKRILADEDFEITESVDHPSRLEDLSPHGAKGADLIVVDNGADDGELDNIRTLHERFPNARLVLLSDEFDMDTMATAFRMGAHGYIVKEISCAPLIGSLQLVAMGEKVMPTRLADEFPLQMSYAHHDGERGLADAHLSTREVEILQCLIMGHPNKIISRQLEISEATVKVHVKAILRKLHVQNRTQAAIWAVNRGVGGDNDIVPASLETIANDRALASVAA